MEKTENLPQQKPPAARNKATPEIAGLGAALFAAGLGANILGVIIGGVVGAALGKYAQNQNALAEKRESESNG